MVLRLNMWQRGKGVCCGEMRGWQGCERTGTPARTLPLDGSSVTAPTP